MRKFCLVLAMLASPLMSAQASCPTYFYPQAFSTPYVAPPAVIKQSNAYYIFTPGLAIGLYGGEGGYGPAPAAAPKQAGPSPCEVELKSIRAELDAIKSRLAPAPQSLPPQAPAQAPVKPNGSAIVRHCAGCHDQSVAKEKGNALELTAFGQSLRLKAAIAGKVMELSNPVKGTMPKDHPRLTGDEFNEIVKELIVQQSQ